MHVPLHSDRDHAVHGARQHDVDGGQQDQSGVGENLDRVKVPEDGQGIKQIDQDDEETVKETKGDEKLPEVVFQLELVPPAQDEDGQDVSQEADGAHEGHENTLDPVDEALLERVFHCSGRIFAF